MANMHFGGTISPIRNHVAVKHKIKAVNSKFPLPTYVNSYHNWGIPKTNLASQFISIAEDDDGFVEAYISIKHRLLGIMWHPERDVPFDPINIDLMESFLT